MALRGWDWKPYIKAYFPVLSEYLQSVHMNLYRNWKSHVAHLFQGPLSPSPDGFICINQAALEWIRSRSIYSFLLGTASLKILALAYSLEGEKQQISMDSVKNNETGFQKPYLLLIPKSLPGIDLVRWKETLCRKFALMEIVNHTDDNLRWRWDPRSEWKVVLVLTKRSLQRILNKHITIHKQQEFGF